MGTYTKSWTNRAPRPRSERLRRIGGFAGSVLASASAGSDIPSSAPDWFLPMTLGEETYLLLNPKYVGLAADGWLASGGVGQGASGGGTDLNRVWESLTNNTDFPDEKINLAHIPDVPYTKVTGLDSWIAGKGYALASSVPTALSQLSDDSTHRLVTDAQITEWTNKTGNVQSDWNATTGLSVILNKPSSLPASDVYSWAKAASKPSYSLDEISGTTDLQLIEALTGNGLLRRNNNAWSLDSANYITENQTITLTGDVTGSGKTSIAATIGNGKVTNAKLANSTVGVGSATISLGGSATLSQIGIPLWAQANAKPSYAFSELTSHPTTLSGYGITDAALASDLTALAGRVTSIEDWFEIVTVNGQSALHVKQSRALYADSWIASGGVGSGSGGGGTMVVWGTKSGYTRPLTVEGVTETLLLDGALAGYATTAAMNTALAGKQNAYGFTIQGATGATYNLANFLTSHQSLADYALKAGGTDYNFKVDSLIVTDGGTLDGTTYNGKPVLRFSYRYTDETSMIPTIVSETKYLAYKDEIPTDYVKTSGAQQVSGVKTFLSNIRGGSSASVNWQITTAGAATFASLTLGSGSVTGDVEFGGSLFGPISSGTERYWTIDNDGTASFETLLVGGTALVPSNYVTLSSAQTITGAKTFSAQMTTSGGIVTGGDIRPSTNLGASLGNGNYRFSGLSVNTISSSAYYFRDSAWSSIAHYAGGFDDGIGYMCIYLDADPSNQNPPQNPHYYFFGSGSFQGRGGTKNLGSSGVPWGDFYIAYNKAVKSKDTNGNVRDLMKLANDDGLYIGNSGLSRVQLNSTGYIFMYWGSGDSYATFGAGANVYVPNVLPNGTSGSKLLGSSGWRWSGIYGVNADLTGNLSLSSTSHIDIGPLRIEYDATNKALHITKKDSTDTETYGLYADGFIAAGGVQQTS